MFHIDFDRFEILTALPLWKKILFGAGLVFLLVYAAWCLFRPAPAVSRASFVAAHTSAPVAALPRVEIHPPAVNVVPKKAAVAALDLPREIADDPAAEILTSADFAAEDGDHFRAVPVLNTGTGETTVQVRELPRPLVSFEAGTEIGARYGIRSDAVQEAGIYLRRDLLRVGSVFLAGYAEGSARFDGSRPAAKAMLDVSCRWK